MKKLNTLLASLLLSASACAEIAVIVNPGNSADISADDVKKIYLGKISSFSDGKDALPLTLKEGNALRGDFNQRALGKDDVRYVAYWSKMLFTGAGVPPKEMDSEQAIVELVATNPNTIGFVDSANVSPNVKVVTSF
jgi:ABC-type phosphate transport system substrate-binding protein